MIDGIEISFSSLYIAIFGYSVARLCCSTNNNKKQLWKRIKKFQIKNSNTLIIRRKSKTHTGIRIVFGTCIVQCNGHIAIDTTVQSDTLFIFWVLILASSWYYAMNIVHFNVLQTVSYFRHQLIRENNMEMITFF